MERHGGLVWIVCREVLRHHQDVEDAFQATFFILAERAAKIRSCDSAAAWLYKVAQRTSLAARRKRSRRREEELAAEPPQGDETLPLIHDQHMIYVLMEELRELPVPIKCPWCCATSKANRGGQSPHRPTRPSRKSRVGWSVADDCCGRGWRGAVFRCRWPPAR